MAMNARLVLRTVGAAALCAMVLGPLEAQSPPARAFTPVTDATLRNPSPNDWLHWRRTLDGWGYSPLNQITRENVGQLQLVWSWAMRPGSNQATPLVYNGVMYLANPGSSVQALDAATGDLIWEYEHEYAGTQGAVASDRPMRGLAIWDDKIYVTTADAHIVALDARTGKVAWDVTVADNRKGYTYTSGALVVNGKIVAGMTGCSRYKDDVCFISAHDGRTGKELWRTSTIARPGEAGGETWGDLPLMFRAGGDAWITGSYDPAANLIYFGTAQAKPWARVVRGTEGDALYTNATLALNPDTGKIVWYYQHIPGESHDMDEVFENILVDAGGRQSLFKMGKIGVLWELDRRTGKFLSASDLGYQTLLDVDRRSGKVAYRPGMIPQMDVELQWCPSTAGFKSWRAMAYHPQTQAFYIPLSLHCERGTFRPVEFVEGRGGTGPVRRINQFHPQAPGQLGEFVAMGRDGQILWRQRVRTPYNTAALTTAGGLAVVGDWDRNVYAYDVQTGARLWHARTPTSVQGFPITYAVNGRQYIAVPSGTGGGSWTSLLPVELTPDVKRPGGGNAILVFALPQPPARTSSASASQGARSTPSAPQKVTHEQMVRWEKELSNWGRWGPTDQRGTLNLITPDKTKAALRLVRDGISVSLHRYPDAEKAIDAGNMNAETKHWMTHLDPQTGRVRSALDAVSFATHDGTNTHMDALCHYAVQSLLPDKAVIYNGYPQNLDERGCKDLAIDRMGSGYITRGILIDMPLVKGVEWLEARTPISVADLEAWEKFAGVRIGSGDAVFLRTGRWARRAKTGPWNAARETPGLHASVLPWLKQRDIALLGAEGVADVQPSGVEGWPRPIHDILIPIMGTPLVDNGYFEELAREAARLKRWEFMVSWTLMRIPGGTASPFTALATF
jgi:alcohol dehydrogenase (cytochrome c)